ncbi:MAG: NADH-quinone oxidoreductase subunit NuoN [Ornithinimicrobium sp.]
MEFIAPEIDYWALSPLIAVFVGGLIGVAVEGFAGRSKRYGIQMPLTIFTLVVALGLLIFIAPDHQGLTAAGAVVIDGPALLLQGLVITLSIIGVLVMSERLGADAPDAFTQAGVSVPGSAEEALAVKVGATTTEIYPLTLFGIAGMMLFPMSNDLIVMFIALEILSLPLYVMCGLARRRRLLSQEASLKYFLLGAFSSAFFLFGASLVYGYAGSMRFDEIAVAVSSEIGMDGLLMPGLLLIATGLLFKVGAVPFHSWVPDVYQGAPTPVTGFMAAVTKVAAFGALLRVFYVAGEGARLDWQPILAAVAAITMIVGAVMSVGQNDVKRILAYSSIAHAGFILVGFLALDAAGVSGTMFYLAAYGFMTVPAFALVTMVRSSGSEATHVSQWAGLAKTNPWIAAAFSFLLLAFAGIPLTSGFTGKFAVFSAAIANDGAWLAVIGVLASAVTAYVYFRLIVTMYFGERTGDTKAVDPSSLTTFAIAVGLLVTLGLGIMPSPMLELAEQASQFIR